MIFTRNSVTSQYTVEYVRQENERLIHVCEWMGTFYSDLRPENVLLSQNNKDTTSFLDNRGRFQLNREESIVLCDFEQRGNWHEWCAPEILYSQYFENIRSQLQHYPSKYWSSFQLLCRELCLR